MCGASCSLLVTALACKALFYPKLSLWNTTFKCSFEIDVDGKSVWQSVCGCPRPDISRRVLIFYYHVPVFSKHFVAVFR